MPGCTTPTDNMSKNEPSTSMTDVACESKLRSVVRSSMHTCPGNWVAIGRSVVYFARPARAFSAGKDITLKYHYIHY